MVVVEAVAVVVGVVGVPTLFLSGFWQREVEKLGCCKW